MNLCSRSNLTAEPAKIKQVKNWKTEILNIEESVTIPLN